MDVFGPISVPHYLVLPADSRKKVCILPGPTRWDRDFHRHSQDMPAVGDAVLAATGMEEKRRRRGAREGSWHFMDFSGDLVPL